VHAAWSHLQILRRPNMPAAPNYPLLQHRSTQQQQLRSIAPNQFDSQSTKACPLYRQLIYAIWEPEQSKYILHCTAAPQQHTRPQIDVAGSQLEPGRSYTESVQSNWTSGGLSQLRASAPHSTPSTALCAGARRWGRLCPPAAPYQLHYVAGSCSRLTAGRSSPRPCR
jgi:hypothetical protein